MASARYLRQMWTLEEDAFLIECLLKIKAEVTFVTENGLRLGWSHHLEKMMVDKFGSSGIKAIPNIEARIKTLKQNWLIIYEMIYGANNPGFGWDAEAKCITANNDVWKEYIKVNKKAVKFRSKGFPNFDALTMVFGKDITIGKESHVHFEIVDELEVLYDELMKVDGLTDDERQHAYVKMIKDDELCTVFLQLPYDSKSKVVRSLLA